MSDKIFGIFGASGFGREVLPLVRAKYESSNCSIVFVDDNPPSDELNGCRVLTYQEFKDLGSGDKYISIAIADARIRELLTERCINDGFSIFDVSASNAVLLDAIEIGVGHVLCPFVTITSNVKIGKSFHANLYSYIAHDCIVGDYVTLAPSVKCNGNVHICDGAYIGTGAIIKQGAADKPIIIGKNAVVGMGAVVTKNVAEGDVVFGVPAKSIKRGK